METKEFSERRERSPFKYNPNASYNPNIKYSKKDQTTGGALPLNLVNQIIFVNQKDSFQGIQ